jgi:hypothetical protein
MHDQSIPCVDHLASNFGCWWTLNLEKEAWWNYRSRHEEAIIGGSPFFSIDSSWPHVLPRLEVPRNQFSLAKPLLVWLVHRWEEVVWDLEPSCGNLVEEVGGRGSRSTDGKVEHRLNEFRVWEEGHGFQDERAQDGFVGTNSRWNELEMDSSR